MERGGSSFSTLVWKEQERELSLPDYRLTYAFKQLALFILSSKEMTKKSTNSFKMFN